MDDEIDDLYALPPGEFTAARDALVKQLRTEKRRDDANAVKALRRPNAAAWALNQVARRHPDALQRLATAGAQLASSQRRVLSGVKDAGLREAGAARREVIDDVWQLAAAVLAEEGSDPVAHRQAVIDTLEAASIDPEALAAVTQGRLTTQLAAPSDFGAVSGFAVVDGETASEPAPDDADEEHSGQAAQQKAKARRQQAEKAAQAAANAADAAQRKAGDARQRAVRAQAEAERLQRKADEAAAEASARLADAEALEEAAEAARDEAERLAGQIPD